MNATRRAQLIRQSAVAKSSITIMQTFIESRDRKLNDIQVRFYDLKASLIEMTQHNMNWNFLMTKISVVIENYLKISTTNLRLISLSCYILWLITTARKQRITEHWFRKSNHTPRSHAISSHIKLWTIALPTFEGDSVVLYITETYLRH